MKSSSYKFRIRFILAGIVCAVLIIEAALYNTQIIKGDYYRRVAENQYYKEESAYFDRGSILLENKDGSRTGVAIVKDGYDLIINPQLIKDPKSVYKSINEFLDISETDFISKANDPQSKRKVVLKKVDSDIGAKIRDLKIPGVSLVPERWRYYPASSLASHVLGFVGFNKENELTGQYGLEKYYESVLSRSGEKVYSNFFADLFSNVKEDGSLEGDIVIGIDREIQNYVEDVLKKISKDWSPENAGIVVMDPHTGQIYAMAGIPNFNPNYYGAAGSVSDFKNSMVQDRYELGSIMKPITMAIGIDSGVIDEKSQYNDTGSLVLNKKTIRNFDGKARGLINIAEVLKQSLNVGSAGIAIKVGQERFRDYMNKFGFNDKTGIDQPYEISGDLRPLNSGRDVDIATASFGQNVSLTPMEMVRALSVLANGGKLVQPHIAKSIDYRIGIENDIDVATPVQIIKPETSEKVTKMLVSVVDDTLRQGKLKNPRYTVAAKTGTAQMADPKGGGYYTDRYLHSFFGYFPAYNPKFIVFLFQVHPKGAQYASETLTDPFMNITNFLIKYYEIAPDR